MSVNLNDSEVNPHVEIPEMIVDTETREIMGNEVNTTADLAENYPLGTSVATDLSGASDEGAPTLKGRCIDKLERVQWLSLFGYNTGIYHNGKTKYSSACATLTSIFFIFFVIVYSFSEIFSFDDILSVIIFEETY
tara:strand:- start:294 stop:701 length:408 start_codon:yes stop_codon:yes gene_type:complete